MAASEMSAVEAAAKWLSQTKREEIAGAVVPTIQSQFGLAAVEACAAIREANVIRVATHRNGEAAS